MSRKIQSALLVLMLAAVACGLPSTTPTESPDAIFTAAAETVAARLTQAALQSPVPQNTPLPPTFTPIPPTNTLPPAAATNTPQPCNVATFVADVTIPDGSLFAPGQTFTKTWKLRNVGTCTWTSGYQLVFDRGDQMGGPVSQQLTTGSVAPGQDINISVNLTAPATLGAYRGYWRLKDPAGVLFALTSGNSFYVDIKVAAATVPAPTTNTIYAPLVLAESGYVVSDGSLGPSVPNVGDNAANLGVQAFVSFDISALPAGVTITEVSIDTKNYDMLGLPFSGLSCLYLYTQDYGTLSAGDYVVGSPPGALLRWCSDTSLQAIIADGDLTDLVQSKVGTTRVQMRLQFKDVVSDNDGTADMVRFGPNIRLTIKYTTP